MTCAARRCDGQAAVVGPLLPREQPQKRGLPGAVVPHDPGLLARPERAGHTVQHHAVAIALGHLGKSESRPGRGGAVTVVLSTEPRRRQSVLRSRGGPFGARLECVVQQLENPLSRQGQGPGVGLVRVRCHGRHHRTTGHDQPPRTAAVEGTTITGQGVDVSLRDIARRAGPDEFGEHRPPRERRPRARSRRSRACGPGNSAARLSDEVSLGHGQPSGTFAAARGTEEVLVGRRLATRARRGWLWQWLVPHALPQPHPGCRRMGATGSRPARQRRHPLPRQRQVHLDQNRASEGRWDQAVAARSIRSAAVRSPSRARIVSPASVRVRRRVMSPSNRSIAPWSWASVKR